MAPYRYLGRKDVAERGAKEVDSVEDIVSDLRSTAGVKERAT